MLCQLKTGCFSAFLQIRGSHRTATVPTYDDLVEYEALLQIKPANSV